MRKLRNYRGQSTVEFAVLTVIVIIVFFVMQHYMKRAMQGRYKTSVDDMGEQYDPRYTNGYLLYTYQSTSNSEIYTVPASVGGSSGFWTNRVDSSQSKESKKGTMTIGTP